MCYHVCCSIWDSKIGKELLHNCEPTEEWDGYAVAIIKDGIMVGHLLQTFCAFIPCFFEQVEA